jgi:hypothetical protein
LQEKREDNRPSPVLFYEHHAWWVMMTEPLAGQKKLEPKLLGKAEIGCGHSSMYWAAMEWRFPPDSQQVAKHIEITSNDYWINDKYMAIRRVLETAIRFAADEKQKNMELQLQSNIDADTITDLRIQIDELEAENSKGKGKAGKGKFLQTVLKTGWMNKMIALIGAVHTENTGRMEYLCRTFLGCRCKCVCVVALMLICVFYDLV